MLSAIGLWNATGIICHALQRALADFLFCLHGIHPRVTTKNVPLNIPFKEGRKQKILFWFGRQDLARRVAFYLKCPQTSL